MKLLVQLIIQPAIVFGSLLLGRLRLSPCTQGHVASSSIMQAARQSLLGLKGRRDEF